MNTSTGKISGTPLHNSIGENSYYPLKYYFYIQASNSSGTSAPKRYMLRVYEPASITTSATLARGDVGVYYNQTIKATGTEQTMRWKLIGALPPGLKFKGSINTRTATIYGTPTMAGEYKFKIQCYNVVGNATATSTETFTIIIGNVPKEWSDSRINLYYNYWKFMDGRVGSNYSDYIGVTDSSTTQKNISGKYIVLLDAGELPTGLYLKEENSSARALNVYLKGVPSSAGEFSFRLKVKRISDGGYNTRTFRVKINSSSTTQRRDYGMSLWGTLIAGKLAVPYERYFGVAGGTAPFKVSVSGGTLPQGLTLSQSGRITYLNGTPKRVGKFNFTIRVTGAHNGYVEKTVSLEIKANGNYTSGAVNSDTPTKPKFVSTSLPKAAVGTEYEATLQAYGTQPIMWSAVTSMPKGFDLDPETGKITGIPIKAGKYRFKVKAENELGSVTKKLTIKVLEQKPVIQTQDEEASSAEKWNLPDGVLKVPYSVQLEATGTGTIKWSKIGNLPNGLSLNKSKGIISGTPKKAGTFEFSIKAKNKAGSNTVKYVLTILDAEDEKDAESEVESDIEVAEDFTEISQNSMLTDEVKINNTGSGSVFTELFVLKNDEKFNGVVNCAAGEAVNFVIGEWVDSEGRKVKVSDIKIFVNDTLADKIEISDDGTFTIPQDLVSGDFNVYATAQYGGQELNTSEIFVSTAENENSSEKSGSSGAGCSTGAGIAGVFLGLLAFLKKTKK